MKQMKCVPLLLLVISMLFTSSTRGTETVIPQDQTPPPDAPTQAADIPTQAADVPTQAAEQPKHDDHGHHHEAPASGEKPDPLKHVKDVGHIREHLKEQYGFNDEQANQYLKEYDAQTQFFVMHDYDNNTKLDGLELLKSMTHYHDEHDESHDGADRDNSETLVEFVDMILKDQDYNNDGFIDYPEYITYYSKFDQNSPPSDEGSHAHS